MARRSSTTDPGVTGPASGESDSAGIGASVQMRPQRLSLSPAYRHVRDSILRPHLRITESRYFWERWKPRLGPDATVLIMEVRDRCNRSLGSPNTDAGPDGVGRDCTVGATELASACGFSRVTLWRLLQREDVRQFVWVEHNYVYDKAMGKRRRTISTYHVLMEDPLTVEDELQIREVLGAGNDLSVSPGVFRPVVAPGVHFETLVVESKVPTGQRGSGPTFQFGRQVVDTGSPLVQSETTPREFILEPENVQGTILKKRLETAERRDPTSIAAIVYQSGRADPRSALAALTRPIDAEQGRSAPDRTVARPQTGPQTGPSGTLSSYGEVRAPNQRDEGSYLSGASAVPSGSVSENHPDFAPFLERAEQLLGDRHSRGFYVTALRRLYPEHMDIWHRALGLAAEQAPETIRRSRGALFTSLLRTFAQSAGISLAARVRPGA